MLHVAFLHRFNSVHLLLIMFAMCQEDLTERPLADRFHNVEVFDTWCIVFVGQGAYLEH